MLKTRNVFSVSLFTRCNQGTPTKQAPPVLGTLPLPVGRLPPTRPRGPRASRRPADPTAPGSSPRPPGALVPNPGCTGSPTPRSVAKEMAKCEVVEPTKYREFFRDFLSSHAFLPPISQPRLCSQLHIGGAPVEDLMRQGPCTRPVCSGGPGLRSRSPEVTGTDPKPLQNREWHSAQVLFDHV